MSNIFDEIRKVIGRKPIHESVEETTSTEQIDELSKKTLGSYIKKASTDVYSKGFEQGIEKDYYASNNIGIKSRKRLKNIYKASNKLTKEEIEILESLLVKAGLEDLFEEQIDELSKDTLNSYIKKAAESEDKHLNAAALYAKPYTRLGQPTGRFNYKKKDYHSNRALNRSIGIKKATNKLTKEEIEILESLKKTPIADHEKHAKNIINTGAFKKIIKYENNRGEEKELTDHDPYGHRFDLERGRTIQTHRHVLNRVIDGLENKGYKTETGRSGLDNTQKIIVKHPKIKGHIEFNEAPYYDHLAYIKIHKK